MTNDSEHPSYRQLVQQLRDRTAQQPAKRHRTTIYRTAQKLVQGAEGCSGGVYWTPEQIASWHPDDFHALSERVGAAGVRGMDIRGELCFSCDP